MGSWLDNYQASIRNSDPGDFELMQQRAEEQDPEAAFWLHEFYKFCDDVPRSDWQFDYALARTERRVDHAVDHTGDARGLWRVQNALDWYEQGYKLCSFLGPDFDTKAASLAWLETSADLGHMPALRLYHSQARQLLTDDDSTLGFQQPDLIRQFKSNAKRYARELLATGHPQGYLLMARMYYVGDVYEQDFLNAYAYARAGYLVGTAGGQADAQMWMRLIGTKLPPAEIANADKLANEILGSN
jgi:TPR repeat protein